MLRLVLSVVFCTLSAHGFGEPDWGTLRVSWGPMLTLGGAFDKMPASFTDAEAAGWTVLTQECSGTFPGVKYWKNGDAAVILVYSSDGLIAGIMSGLKASVVEAQPEITYKWDNGYYTKMTFNDEEYFVLTAYFVDPSTVCTGRNGEATELGLVTGPDPLKNREIISLNEATLNRTASTWVKGKCFAGMGMHYWYNSHVDSDCDTLRPNFVLYDEGKLVAFGFTNFGNYNTNRFEHPISITFPLFFKEVPACLAGKQQTSGVATFHIYMTNGPWFNGLPFGC